MKEILASVSISALFTLYVSRQNYLFSKRIEMSQIIYEAMVKSLQEHEGVLRGYVNDLALIAERIRNVSTNEDKTILCGDDTLKLTSHQLKSIRLINEFVGYHNLYDASRKRRINLIRLKQRKRNNQFVAVLNDLCNRMKEDLQYMVNVTDKLQVLSDSVHTYEVDFKPKIGTQFKNDVYNIIRDFHIADLKTDYGAAYQNIMYFMLDRYKIVI